MNVNQKGVLGLIKVIEDLSKSGYYVFTAFDDHSPVDVIAMSPEGKTVRLQIKYRERNPRLSLSEERYSLEATTIVNGKRRKIDRTLIDGWAVYMANRNEVIYIPVTAMGTKNMLSVNPKTDYGRLGEW